MSIIKPTDFAAIRAFNSNTKLLHEAQEFMALEVTLENLKLFESLPDELNEIRKIDQNKFFHSLWKEVNYLIDLKKENILSLTKPYWIPQKVGHVFLDKLISERNEHDKHQEEICAQHTISPSPSQNDSTSLPDTCPTAINFRESDLAFLRRKQEDTHFCFGFATANLASKYTEIPISSVGTAIEFKFLENFDLLEENSYGVDKGTGKYHYPWTVLSFFQKQGFCTTKAVNDIATVTIDGKNYNFLRFFNRLHETPEFTHHPQFLPALEVFFPSLKSTELLTLFQQDVLEIGFRTVMLITLIQKACEQNRISFPGFIHTHYASSYANKEEFSKEIDRLIDNGLWLYFSYDIYFEEYQYSAPHAVAVVGRTYDPQRKKCYYIIADSNQEMNPELSKYDDNILFKDGLTYFDRAFMLRSLFEIDYIEPN